MFTVLIGYTSLAINSLYLSLVAINPSFRRTAFYKTDVDDFVPSEGKWHEASTTALFDTDGSSKLLVMIIIDCVQDMFKTNPDALFQLHFSPLQPNI
jgi:hypothetical protein